MMKVTNFNQRLWGLTTFDKVGYDKEKQTLVVFFLDGSQIEFLEVEEAIIFEFIITSNKEAFVKDTLLSNYNFTHNQVDFIDLPSY